MLRRWGIWLARAMLLCLASSGWAKTVYIGLDTPFTLTSADFAESPVFTASSVVTATYLAPLKHVKTSHQLKTLAATGDSITLKWTKAVKLYDQKALKGKLLSAVYNQEASPAPDLRLEALVADGAACLDNVVLSNPFIQNVVTNPDKAGGYLLTGKLLGPGKPKVSVEYVDTKGKPRLKRCSVSDLGTVDGAQTLSFHYSSFDGEATGFVVVQNRIGVTSKLRTPTVAERWDVYLAAVTDAKVRDVAKIDRKLDAVINPQYTPGLKWQTDSEGVQRALMTTWTYSTNYVPDYTDTPNWVAKLKPGDNVTTKYGPLFVVTATELQEWADHLKLDLDTDTNINYRVAQLLGMPPTVVEQTWKNAFLEVWVKPADLYRPAPDPETTDHEAEMDFSYANIGILSVTDTYRSWYAGKIAQSYKGDDKTQWWPFTGFGYAYDWGNPDSAVGLSEFVIRGGANSDVPVDLGTATYIVNQVAPTRGYLEE